jgi:putative ABC transport system ATP-binding protein
VSQSEAPAAGCENLFVTYRAAASRVTALRNVTAVFPRGQMTALVGPSGSGKSSLLKILAGLLRPSSGRVVVGGMRVDKAPARSLRRLRRRQVTFMFQRPSDNLLSFLNVEEQLKLSSGELRAHSSLDTAEALERLGIGHKLRAHPAQLSGGEQQRVALATALVRGAELVLADEPTSELDTWSARSVLASFRVLIDAGVTCVVATHDRSVASEADQIVELEHGAIVNATSRRTRSLTAFDRAGIAEGFKGSTEHFGEAVLRVMGITKSYGEGTTRVAAVRSASFELRSGEYVAIVGRSGSGKTTLLNIVAGWERQDSGNVVWPDVAHTSPLHWGVVAVVPQRLGLLEELTVIENVEYPARLMGSLNERRSDCRAALELLAIDHLAGRYPREISVGEQQRTALARALILAPKVLIADEATGHQDAASADKVMAAIQRSADQGTSVIVATHHTELADRADRILVMRDGRLHPS